MTSVLNVDTIAAKNGTSTVGLTKQNAAKGFAQVTAAAGVRGSLNISSGTDHGTGDYSFSMTNAMSAETDYAHSGMVRDSAGGIILTRNSSRDTASVAAIETSDNDGTARDAGSDFCIHGDLA